MDLLGRDHSIQTPAIGGAHIHELDEAEDVALLPGEGGQIQDLVLVHAPLQHAVQLDGAKPCGPGSLQAIEDPGQGQVGVAEALKALGAKGVQAHREAAQARPAQGRGQLRQQDAIAGEGQILKAGQGRQHLDQVGQLPAEQGLAAREAELGHAQASEDACQTRDLLEAEQGLAGQEGVVRAEDLPGHAVAATEVAAVRDRHAEGLEGAAEGVAQFHISPA